MGQLIIPLVAADTRQSRLLFALGVGRCDEADLAVENADQIIEFRRAASYSPTRPAIPNKTACAP